MFKANPSKSVEDKLVKKHGKKSKKGFFGKKEQKPKLSFFGKSKKMMSDNDEDDMEDM